MNAVRWCRPLLALALLVVTWTAQAGITLDLGYVDKNSAEYARFKSWVDSAVDGSPGYAFSATDAAYAYRLDGSSSYCQLAVAMTEQQVAEAEAEIAAGRRPAVSYDSYLDVGGMIGDLALTYDWCAAFTSASQRTRWAAYAEQAVWNVWHPDDATWGGLPFPWSGWSTSDPGNNYYYSFLQATMYWTMAGNSMTWRQFLEAEKLPPLVTFFANLPGGGSGEGTGYGLSHQRLFELYRVWRDYTGSDLGAQSTHLTDSIDWWLHATMPTLDRMAPVGDQSRVSYPELYDYHRNVILQARTLTADANARAHADWWLHAISVPQMTSGFNFRHDLLPSSDNGSTPSALYYYAPGTGRVFARTDWSQDAMWLGFAAGRYDQSHAHQDQGAFTLFAHDFLAVSENIFTHSGIEGQTAVQNVLRFVADGNDIPQYEGTTSSMTLTPGANGALDISADLTPAYAGHPAIGAWTRDLHFAERKLTVHDSFDVATGVQAVFQINTPVMPTITGRSAQAGDLHVNVLQPADAVITALQWSTLDPSEYYSGWKLEVTGSGSEFLVELSDASSPVATLASLNASPNPVIGGDSATGTVTLSTNATTDAMVSLGSANAAIAVPANVTVAQGSSSATFPISTSAVSTTTLATLSALYGGITRTTVFTVNPATPATPSALATLTLSPKTVIAPATSTGTVTLTAPAPAGGITVLLKSSRTTVATVPASVTVATGATSAHFTVSTLPRRNNASVSISARYGGITRKATLTVKPH